MKDKTFLVIGATGQLGSEFQNKLSGRGLYYVAPKREEYDFTNFMQMRELINRVRPAVIINCAAYNLVDEAEAKSELAYMVNSNAVRNLAELCKENNIFLVHYSTDYVFDGKKQALYTEDDEPNPLNIYGKSKLEGEQIVRDHLSEFLLFRLSWVMGKGKQNFLYKFLNWAEKRRVLKISCDEVSVPTYTEDIVNVTLLSLERGLNGLYHLTNSGYASRYELARYLVLKLGLENLVIPVPMKFFKARAKRPLFTCMSNKKISKELGISIPTWEDGIDRIVQILEKNVA
ncbi:MAG: dTDP-4-dehydrorhamnose reductase [Candidatus Scalinduaceae bacterium]